MRVGVVGAGGKMGAEVCRTVLARPDLDLVAAVDPFHDGSHLSDLIGAPADGLMITGDLGALTEVGAEVVVDFTRVGAARATLAFCADAGIHAVVGTTGFTEADLAELARRFAGPETGSPNCVVAANFAVGAVLMMRFAEMASAWFDGAEIVESHHDGKLDAPSGTALRTAALMAAARASSGSGDFPPDHTVTSVLDGARGAQGPAGVRIHSLRLPGLVAHQEVILGAVGQSLTIRHDSYDRTSFMDGVVLAVRSVSDRPGLTLGLEPLLGL
ncbi:MAG: 4-hydroxy-tetrahydrodipicolinate reductase [Acidimicrobiales bacterium]|nr:4-hydroxy-tetrahydrodipicolinate reductase [Acidimicrobiales bacterium]